jgi:branched-chain amino acid transport system substrate-binding protein
MAKQSAALAVILTAVATMASGPAAHSQQSQSIRIGYAISLSGPNAAGAAATVLPNYRLWRNEVNAAGGIMLESVGKRMPIAFIEYDDHSNVEDALAAVERLINVDKVDFILPPWGTGLNLAVAPLSYHHGYPLLAVTALNDDAPQLGKRWPNSFWFLGTTTGAATALVETLSDLRAAGRIGDNVAMVSVADQFGIGLAKAARRIFKRASFDIIYDRPYPVEAASMHDIIAEVQQLHADTFVAFSYPPDTMALAEQASVSGFNPKVFYTAVGTAYPAFKQRFGTNANGVMGIGGWDAESAESRRYMKRFVEVIGEEPDRWASPITYASLQMLQQAIERVGRIDRAAVIKELQTGTFATILGAVKLQDNLYTKPWYVGQWQNGEFYGVAPATLPGAHAVMFPKPAWHAGQ